ncbi:MAG: hypothetical protein QXM96_00225 [Candidatus Woesearchaeota archaeon]
MEKEKDKIIDEIYKSTKRNEIMNYIQMAFLLITIIGIITELKNKK